MKKFYFTLFFALVLCGFSNAQTFNAIEPELQTILDQKGENLVDIHIYFKSKVDSKQLNQKTRKLLSKSEKRNIVVNELKNHASTEQADVMAILKAEESNGNVSNIKALWISNSISCKASRNVIYQLSSHPNIEIIGVDKEIQMISPEQMKEIPVTKANITRGPAAHIVTVNADDVQNQGYTGKNVIVAVLDSGTNTEHVDLKDHLWEGYVDGELVNGWNYTSNNSNITDDFGHGSHCAGIVCGDGTSGTTTGIAPDALLMTLKTVNRAGGGSVAQMLSGVQFAVDNGADIMSMSLGFKHSQLTVAQKESIREAFDNVLTAGVVVCAAVGNDGTSIGLPWNVDYPAACPAPWSNPDQTLTGGLSSVIAVGADDLIGSSSQGPSTWEDTKYNEYAYNDGASMGLIRPDISAPGNMVISSNFLVNNEYKLNSGTSQATPCVAGVIALMLEKNMSLTPAQISQIIEETAANKPASKNNVVGAGRVDALAAINAVTAGTGTPYLEFISFTPEATTPGQTLNLSLKFKNNGRGSSATNASATISSDSPYVTVTEVTQTLGQISVGAEKSLNFEVKTDAATPNGHVANFNVVMTSGNFSWKDKFSIKVSANPEIVFSGVTPGVINADQDVNINVTITNDGAVALNNPIQLELKTISSSGKYVTIVDGNATVGALAAGESGTGTFTIRTNSTIPHNYGLDFFLNVFSEADATTSYLYEFENDIEGWTSFDAADNGIKTPGWHSSEAAQRGKTKVASFSGNNHMMSASNEEPKFYSNPLDNYLVAPKKVKATADSKFSFYARPTYNYYEHFGVAVSTSGNTSAADFTTIKEWTFSGVTSWTKYEVDLSKYAGQEIYVAIRHFFTQAEWTNSMNGADYDALCIDDVEFSDVFINVNHTPTYDYDDPYYFNVYVNNMIDLPKVENLSATATSTSEIALTWNAVDKAHSYNVYRNGQRIATVTENSYTDQNLTHNTLYCYDVAATYSGAVFEHSDETCATTIQKTTSVALKEYSPDVMYVGVNDDNIIFVVKNDGSADLSSKGSIEITCDNSLVRIISGSATSPTLPEGEAPAAPQLVNATATGETSISISWSTVVGATSYIIYSSSGTDTNKIGETTSTTYNISGLTSGTTYYYYVTAVNAAGESAASSLTYATTNTPPKEVPAAPTNLTADATTTGTGDNAILLQWDAVDGATSYTIYSGTSKVATVTETTYTVVINATDPLTNCYTVIATNANGNSPASNEACATAGRVEYYIKFADSDLYLTIYDNNAHTSGDYGGVCVGSKTGSSKQKFIIEGDIKAGTFYLCSKDGYYIKCQDNGNVDASETSATNATSLKVNYLDTETFNIYIEGSESSDNGWFKTAYLDSENRRYVYSNGASSDATSLETWTLEPVVSTTRTRSASNTRDDSPVSYAIGLMASRTEITNYVTIEVDAAIPNNTNVTFYVRVNNDAYANATVPSYNFTLPFNVLIKNDPWAPKNLQVLGWTDNSLTLEWNEVTGAIGYNVYRDGVLVGTVSSTLFFDNGLEASTTYCYNVTSINAEGESEFSMEACGTTLAKASGILFKSFVLENSHLLNTELPLEVTLINDSGAATPAGTATLTCSDPNVSIVDGEADLQALADGGETTVTFTIKLLGTTPVNHELDFNVTTEYKSAGGTGSTVYSYSFDDDMCEWTSIDANNDNHTWFHYPSENVSDHGMSDPDPHTGTGYLLNSSYCSKHKYNNGSGALEPDDYIVSPVIKATKNVTVSFWVRSMGSSSGSGYYMEHYGLAVSKSSNATAGAFATIYENTISEARTWKEITVSLDGYLDGYTGNIYVAIRHFNCTNLQAISIDDVKITCTSDGTTNSNTSTFSATVNPSLNVFEGTGVWSDASKWSKDIVPIETDDVIINGEATIESGDITVNSISINSNIGASLTINSGVNLAVEEVLNSTNADAFIINDGCQIFQPSENVAATFRMLIDNPSSWNNDRKGGWQFISSPMEGVAISDFATTTSDYDLFKYDGTVELEWVNIKNHGTDFETEFLSGRGYIVSYEAQTRADFKGILNNDKSFNFADLNPVADYHYENFYLLGNPFAFDMEWSNAKMTVSGVYNGYATISNVDGSYDYHTSGTIKVGDGFMVKVTEGTPYLGYGGTRSRSVAKNESLNVVSSNIYGSDNVIVRLAGEEEEGFTKLNNLNEDIAEIYISNNGERFGIFSYDEDVKEVNLSFKTKHTGSHIISIEPEGEFEYVTLVDNFTGKETDMLKERYEFMVYSTEGSRERFTLKFSKKAEPESENFVYQSGNELIVEAEGTVQIIDVMGRMILSEEVNGNGRINISGLDKAAYIVRCIGSSKVNTQKIIIL